MTTNVLIFNSQAAGDCLLGTHAATVYKKLNPDSKIYFTTRYGLTPSTSEFENEVQTLLRLLHMQNYIDGVGFIVNQDDQFKVRIVSQNDPIEFDEIIEQHNWFSDLGIVASQCASLHKKYGQSVFEDTETRFNVGTAKVLPKDQLVVSMAGPLDWNRKTKNESLRLKVMLGIKQLAEKYKIQIKLKLIGRDVEDGDLIESLQNMNNTHLYLGPIGLPCHAAAGLGLDTISISSVYPAEYDSPEFYHSGWHKTVNKPKNHCGSYVCVTPKIFQQDNTPEGPKTLHGFWTKKCEVTSNKLSCVNQTEAQDVLSLFETWIQERVFT